MAYIRQSNFSGGEFSPRYWGRTDIEKFSTGGRRYRDFFPALDGSLVSRPGTKHLGYANAIYDLNSDQRPVRLIPFVYSDSQSYVLEFGNLNVRFWSSGSLLQVAVPNSNPVTYQDVRVSVPYRDTELGDLRYAQVGDVLYLAHPNYSPRRLTRKSHSQWVLEELPLVPPWPWFVESGAPLYPPMLANASPALGAADTQHPAREWRWMVTVVYKDLVTGAIGESLPHPVTHKFTKADPYDGTTGYTAYTPGSVVLYPDRYAELYVPTGPSAPQQSPPGWESPSGGAVYLRQVVAFNYYRGRAGVYGFVGQSTTRAFVDVADEPNYLIQPPTGDNPFEQWSSARPTTWNPNRPNPVPSKVEKPSVVAFYENRLTFAATAERPSWLFFSRSGNYFDFDRRTVPFPGQALQLELATRKREHIRGLVPLDHLLIFTSSSVWALSGHEGSPLDYDKLNTRVIEEIGSTTVEPLSVDGAALYCRAKGSGVRAIVPGQGGYQGVDLSRLSEHFFEATESPIVEWAYAEDPWGLLWCRRNDGSLLTLTFSREQQVWAWAKHTITSGTVESVCCVPEGNEDVVYLAVRRTATVGTSVAIERFASRLRYGTTADDICTDSTVTITQTTLSKTVTGLTHLNGRSVYVYGKDNPPSGPYTVATGELTLSRLPIANSGGNCVLHVGMLYQPEYESLDAVSTESRLRQKNLVSVGLEVDNSKGLEVGPSLTELTPWRQRAVSHGYGAISVESSLVSVPVRGSWGLNARVAIRQTEPLPVTVLAFVEEVDVGG